MFYDNYVALCVRKGTTPTSAAIEMGFNRSMVTRWGNGAVPRKSTLYRIADYFGVPVSDLTGDGDSLRSQEASQTFSAEPILAEKTPVPTDGDGLTELQRDLIEQVKTWDEKKLRRFLRLVEALEDDEDGQQA